MREVLLPAHPQPGPDDVSEDGIVGRDNQVTGPHQHQPGRVDGPVDLGDRDLPQVPPAAGGFEKKMPLPRPARPGARPAAPRSPVRGVPSRAPAPPTPPGARPPTRPCA